MMIMSTIVTIIKHVIMDFLNSNLFQTLVLIVTVVVTILIFRANKREKRKNAVTILMLQIREIEKNIEFLLSEGMIDGNIQQRPVHYSALVYDENYWSKYSHLIVGKMSQLSFQTIDAFFKTAQQIREQQILIKNKVLQSMDFKCMYYYNGIYTRVNTLLDREKPDLEQCGKEIKLIMDLYNTPMTNGIAFVQKELAMGLEQNLKKYHKLTDGMAFAELERLSK